MVFASIMLVVVGAVNMVQGFVALFQDDYFVVRSGDQLLLLVLHGLGLVPPDLGGAQLLAGLGLNTGHGWARLLALGVACISIVIKMLFLAAFPVWSVVIIALDVIVIYALTARWSEARPGLYTFSGRRARRAAGAPARARARTGRLDAGPSSPATSSRRRGS